MLSTRCAIFVILACPAVAWAADEITERAVPIQELTVKPTPSRSAVANPALEQTVALLQQQVQSLQAQLAALQAAVQVTPNGMTLQGPTVTIAGGNIQIQAQQNTAITAASTLTLQSGGATALQASGSLNLKGSTIVLNGGTKPLATVGSQVQVPGQPIGQIMTGSGTLMGN